MTMESSLMSIINFTGNALDLTATEEMIFYIDGDHLTLPEEYRILKAFNPEEVELSLTHRGRKPSPEAMVEFLIMQGFIRARRIQ